MAAKKGRPKQAPQAMLLFSAQWMKGVALVVAKKAWALRLGGESRARLGGESRPRAREMQAKGLLLQGDYNRPHISEQNTFTRPSRVNKRCGSQSQRAYRHDKPTRNVCNASLYVSSALARCAVRGRTVRGWGMHARVNRGVCSGCV